MGVRWWMCLGSVFSSLFSSFIMFRILARNFGEIKSANSIKWLNSVCPAIWLRKDKVCALKIGSSHKGAEKCVMFLTWQMHRLAWWRWAWQLALLPGHLQGMCVFLYCCQELFFYSFPIFLSENAVLMDGTKGNYAKFRMLNSHHIVVGKKKMCCLNAVESLLWECVGCLPGMVSLVICFHPCSRRCTVVLSVPDAAPLWATGGSAALPCWKGWWFWKL